ncbi:molecular chaperone TorD family protein [Vibrio europaeus]|uniref:Molecular chaperone n=1 Tax=Vibrio europaeus TaxID=300876 RepID=A0A178JE27_9VIBR|nr:molecular chaperone TorD family protein [Vibrio europaeus]MDC5706445.1 molecular chaperone TorD family protein [Vibrio europaeus]MDC5708491.1 molecular chaperone TorD family protein [Vibrio europaeus]MDC5714194.1 molecular chaperone TorD family protein [Vibrio europaeus]MDC5719347.1 molecular chaperone TorD family protein [Vibrio europaeus]MDC5723147.1 molecular chaperone TorD family protein [Vibrio europaeus]
MDNQQQTIRADIYLLLSSLYRQQPSTELIAFLSQLETEQAESAMQLAWHKVKSAAIESSQEQLEDEYQELFIGIGRGEVVPFASWHLTGSLMEKPLASIRHDLGLLGLEREEQVKEPEDHFSALCEVMSVLTEEEEELQQVFFNKHLGTWFNSLVKQVKEARNASFYLTVAELTNAFMTLEQVRFSANLQNSKTKLKIDVKNVTEYEQPQQ